MTTIDIRSYRTVFDLERRIYRVDRLRLNPNGVPVRGVVYWLVLLLSVVVAGKTPLLGTVVGVLPWYLRDLAVPAMGAALLTMIRVEGRPFHLAGRSLLRHLIGPRQLAALRPCPSLGGHWRPREIVLIPDGSDGRLRRMTYTGPGVVLVTAAYAREECASGVWGRLVRRPRLRLSELPGDRRPAPAHAIALGSRTRLRVM